MSEASDTPCPKWQDLIHSLVDGELDAEHSRRVEAHLAEHPACAREMQRLMTARARIRSAHAPLRAPDALKRRIIAEIASGRPDAAGWRAWWQRLVNWLRAISLPLSGAILAASLVIAVVPHGRQPSDLAADLTSAHVRSLLADHLTDVATSDRHTVKPWFNGKVAFSPPVVDLATGGFPLVGGRVDYVAGRVVAALVYRHKGHVINLFIWPGASGPAERLELGGYNLASWQMDDLTYWAVSDVGVSELAEFTADFITAVRNETKIPAQ